jgi:galactokinase
MATIRYSTPGRICLFGEHQDYLHLPVVPCAISLRITIDASHQTQHTISIALPDIASREEFSLDAPLEYRHQRDYLRSGLNVMRRHGFTFSTGIRATICSAIPINAGTSSSSAMLVTWVALLARMSDQDRCLSPEECARYAHEAEVLEFGEPGGQMDHYSTALGGILAIEFEPALRLEKLSVSPGAFVLGNSGEPKDTTGILSRVKNRVLHITRVLEQRHPGFSLHTATESTVADLGSELEPEDVRLLEGTIRNRQLTHTARSVLSSTPVDYRALGSLLDEHHAVLRDVLRISTPKIDRMLDAARAAGAYGGKINGSGGGGCMFVYAPDDPEAVARATTAAGGDAYVVRMTGGVRQEHA